MTVRSDARAAAVGRQDLRTARRSFVVCLAVAIAVSLVGIAPTAADANTGGIVPAPKHLPQTPRVDVTPRTVDLTFPVANPSDVRFSAGDFLALRGGGARLHAASDLMAPKHRPIHAAVGGTITSAPFPEPSYGWMISIRGDDGLRYSYIHLNNDTPTKASNGSWLDDDKGGVEHAYAPRIVQAIKTTGSARGLRIERGELIGFNGDSGNAKGVAPHLHLEIYDRDDVGEYRIDPFHSLTAALARGDVPGNAATAPSNGLPYRDLSVDGVHTGAIVRLTEQGILRGCDGTRYCPRTPITRGDLAAAVAAARGLPDGGTPRFSDVSRNDRNAGAIAAVDQAGILTGYGDGRFGPNDPLPRAQLATMLVQAFGLPALASPAPFVDVPSSSVHAGTISSAYASGLTRGCGDGSRFCPWDDVSREQIATFLESALTR